MLRKDKNCDMVKVKEWLLSEIIRRMNRCFTGNITINFYKGGVTKVTQSNTVERPK